MLDAPFSSYKRQRGCGCILMPQALQVLKLYFLSRVSSVSFTHTSGKAQIWGPLPPILREHTDMQQGVAVRLGAP